MRPALPLIRPALATAALLLTLSPPSQAADGATVDNQTCAMCHVPGLAHAPKFGQKADWAPRLAAGRDALLASALKGKNAMPPRGGNPKLSDEDIAAALDHMLAAAQ